MILCTAVSFIVSKITLYSQLLQSSNAGIGPVVRISVRTGRTCRFSCGVSQIFFLASLYDTAPYPRLESSYRWNIGLLFLVFVPDVGLLFFICRGYAGYQMTHAEKKWLK